MLDDQDRRQMLEEAQQYHDEHGSDIEPPLNGFLACRANGVPVYTPGPVCKPEDWINTIKELAERNKNEKLS